MPAYQVITTYASGQKFDDCVLREHNIKLAREYAAHRYSEAYGFKPGEGPMKIEVKRISAAKADAIVDAGGIDWYS